LARLVWHRLKSIDGIFRRFSSMPLGGTLRAGPVSGFAGRASLPSSLRSRLRRHLRCALHLLNQEMTPRLCRRVGVLRDNAGRSSRVSRNRRARPRDRPVTSSAYGCHACCCSPSLCKTRRHLANGDTPPSFVFCPAITSERGAENETSRARFRQNLRSNSKGIRPLPSLSGGKRAKSRFFKPDVILEEG